MLVKIRQTTQEDETTDSDVAEDKSTIPLSDAPKHTVSHYFDEWSEPINLRASSDNLSSLASSNPSFQRNSALIVERLKQIQKMGDTSIDEP
jgi:hypothetical protein